MAETRNRFSRRAVGLIWLALTCIIIAVLIYFEQIALLYVLATLSLVALLLTVAFADLEKVGVDDLGDFGR